MHSSNLNSESSSVKSEVEVLLAVTTLVTEGRIPEKLGPKSKGFREGPHCFLSPQANEHHCDPTDSLCVNYDFVREEVLKLWMQNIPLCIEVVLTCGCQEGDYFVGPETVESCILIESWNFNISSKRVSAPPTFQVPQLVSAIRSQLYFSQITAWLTTQDENSKHRLTLKHLRYRIALPGETFKTTKFMANSTEHKFPSTDIGCNRILNVSFLSMPRMSSFPIVQCPSCKPLQDADAVNRSCLKENKQETFAGEKFKCVVDDRMHVLCTLKGKHHCEDYEEVEKATKCEKLAKFKRFRQNLREEQPSTSTMNHLNNTRQTHNNHLNIGLIDTNIPNGSIHHAESVAVEESLDKTCHFFNDLICKEEDKSKILLEAIERVGLRSPEKTRKKSSAGIYQYSRHKSTDVEMEIQDDCPLRRTTKVMDMKCENDLVNVNCICPSDRYKNENSLHEIEKNISCSYDKHISEDSEIQENNRLMECASNKSGCDNVHCDTSKSDTCSNRNRFSVYVDKKYCDSPIPIVRHKKMKDISNDLDAVTDKKKLVTRKLTFENFQNAKQEVKPNCNSADAKEKHYLGSGVPSSVEQAKFKKNFDNAASMVFHSRTGLPLTSSPAPVRRGKTCFDFDSSLNSTSAIKSAFSSSFSTDDDSESDGSLVSPCSPDTYLAQRQKVEGEEEPKLAPLRWQHRRKGYASSLLGSFEESVLNGRLEPVSTVHGFTAELGASGSFVPKHLVVPVTVFFYTLGDNDKLSSPYLCHINLGKKGYCVPKRGTVQVTLFNPLGTVVKMFVIIYDLTDMPPNSHTFIRQRTLYMPNDCKDKNVEWGPKWLKYLIHLRFVSSKSGKIYLHSDIRMIIFHKSDLDTATAHGMDLCYELRSFTLMPANPQFSPRK